MANRSLLGAADVDDEAFGEIVARALGEDPATVTVLDCEASVVPYALDAITTAGRYWVAARAATPRGERDVRLFVKHVQSWSRSPLFRQVPEEMRAIAESSVPWRTEPLIYQSDLRDRLPAGLTMPVALHVAFLDEGSAAIWLPALDVDARDWHTADFAQAAHLLGRLAGSADVAELARVGELDGGPRTIRTYADGRLAGQVAPLLRSGALWRVPWIAEAFEPALRERLVAALDEVPGWVEEVEAGPLAVAHGDACPNNLLRTAGSDEITLIDYAFWGRQCLGFDLGQLLVGDVQVGRRPVDSLPEVEREIVPAFVAGLHAEGVDVGEAAVARAHALHLMVFTGLSTALVAPPDPEAAPPDPATRAVLARDARERAAISRFCLGLVEATSG